MSISNAVTRRSRSVVARVTLLLALSLACGLVEGRQDDAFARAQFFEEAEGDLPRAVEAYRAIATNDDIAKDDRTRAWLRTGLCLNEQGKVDEAKLAFVTASEGTGPAAERAKRVLAGEDDAARRLASVVSALFDQLRRPLTAADEQVIKGLFSSPQDRAFGDLVSIGDPAVPFIVEALKREASNTEFVGRLIDALLVIDTPRVGQYFEEVLSGSDRFLQSMIWAQTELAGLGAGPLIPSLLASANASAPDDRAKRLSRVLVVASVEVARRFLDDRQPAVADAALWRLANGANHNLSPVPPEFTPDLAAELTPHLLEKLRDSRQRMRAWRVLASPRFYALAPDAFIAACQGPMFAQRHDGFQNALGGSGIERHLELELQDISVSAERVLRVAEHWRSVVRDSNRVFTRRCVGSLIEANVENWTSDDLLSAHAIARIGFFTDAMLTWITSIDESWGPLVVELYPQLTSSQRTTAVDRLRNLHRDDALTELERVAFDRNIPFDDRRQLVDVLIRWGTADAWAVLELLIRDEPAFLTKVTVREAIRDLDSPNSLLILLARRPDESTDNRLSLVFELGVRGAPLQAHIEDLMTLGLGSLRIFGRGSSSPSSGADVFSLVPWLVGANSRAEPAGYDSEERAELLLHLFSSRNPQVVESWRDLAMLARSTRRTVEFPALFAARVADRVTEHPDETVRGMAVRKVLEGLAPVATQREFFQRMANSSDGVAIRAVLFAAPEGVFDSGVVRGLLRSRDADVRGSAVLTLARNNSVGAIDDLLLLLADPDPRVREQTIRALATLASDRLVERLTESHRSSEVPSVLQDPDENVRAAAVEAVAAHPRLSSAEILVEALRDPSVTVQNFAREALQSLEEYHTYRRRWESWSRSMELNAESAVEALVSQAKSSKPLKIRVAAITSLPALRQPEVLPFLITLLEDDHEEVRTAAENAIDALQNQAMNPGGAPK